MRRNKAAHVLSLVAQCHGGRLYDSAWSKRMIGGGPYAEMLAARFDRACRRLGFAPRTIASARRNPLPSAAATGRPAGAVLIGCRCAGRAPAEGRRRAAWQGKGGSKRSDVEAIFRAFAEVMRELPPDTEAGWLDAEGDLRLAPDIGRKLRTARNVRDVLRQIRESQNEPDQ